MPGSSGPWQPVKRDISCPSALAQFYQMLPIAPLSLIDPNGQARSGRFVGMTGDICWAQLAPPLARSAWWRRFHHKRWLYVALSSERFFCAVALVDVGWSSTAFAYVFDHRLRRFVASLSQDGLPGWGARLADRCGAGACHQFHFGGHHIDCRHHLDRGIYQLQVRSQGFEIDVDFDDDGALLLAVGPVAGGVMHATQKSSALPLRGELRLGDARHDLTGGVASFDYSNGLLARNTAWRWASAHQPGLGFNLQAGYFGNQENALWLDGQLIPLTAAQFDFNPADPMARWQVHTDDGLLALDFYPLGLRREDKNLLLAASRYVQPIGVFSGWVKAAADAAPRAVRDLVGVTEDHQARW